MYQSIMKRIKLLALGLGCVSLSLTSCSSHENDSLPQDATFSVLAHIQGHTRAPQLDASGAGQFQAGDQNTLFFQNPQGTCQKTFNYTYGQTYYWPDLGVNQPAQEVKASACYPPVQTDTPQSYSWDVTATQIPTPDFLAAQPASLQLQNEKCQVSLNFRHLMHQFVVKLTADGTTTQPSELTQATLTLSQWKPVATLNLLTAAVTGATGTPAQKQLTGDAGSFILPPQAVGNIQLQVQVNQRSQTFLLKDLKINNQPVSQLESGKKLSLTIQVSKGSFTITGQSIQGWESQGEANGEIIL